jgi:dienelactone hydrolase
MVAEVLKIEGGKVRIRRADGRVFTIDVATLSQEDQSYIEALARVPDPGADFEPTGDLPGKPGLHIATTEASDFAEGKFAVYIPEGYSHQKGPYPLVVSAHGATANGAIEVIAWKSLAEKYGFVVVCPSYRIASTEARFDAEGLEEYREVLKDIMERVFASLHIDRRFVLHTGYSGGGNPTWLAMDRPEWFTALAFRSANFFGETKYGELEKEAWAERPILTFWGSQDHPIILSEGAFPGKGEGAAGLEFLRDTVGCKRLTHQVIKDGPHANRSDFAADWFAELIAKAREGRPADD